MHLPTLAASDVFLLGHIKWFLAATVAQFLYSPYSGEGPAHLAHLTTTAARTVTPQQHTAHLAKSKQLENDEAFTKPPYATRSFS